METIKLLNHLQQLHQRLFVIPAESWYSNGCIQLIPLIFAYRLPDTTFMGQDIFTFDAEEVNVLDGEMDVPITLKIHRGIPQHISNFDAGKVTVILYLLVIRLHINQLRTKQAIPTQRVHLVGQQGVYPQIAALFEVHSQEGLHIRLLGFQTAFVEQRTVLQEDIGQWQLHFLPVCQKHRCGFELLIHGERWRYLLGMTTDNAYNGEKYYKNVSFHKSCNNVCLVDLPTKLQIYFVKHANFSFFSYLFAIKGKKVLHLGKKNIIYFVFLSIIRTFAPDNKLRLH